MQGQSFPGKNATLFMASGFLIVAWHIAPDSDSAWQRWVLTTLLAAGGVEGFIRTTQIVNRARGPRPAPRTLPLWLALWLVLGGLAWSVGTPHLRIEYGPGGCVYAGWNGFVRHGAYPCPLVTTIPLKGSTDSLRISAVSINPEIYNAQEYSHTVNTNGCTIEYDNKEFYSTIYFERKHFQRDFS